MQGVTKKTRIPLERILEAKLRLYCSIKACSEMRALRDTGPDHRFYIFSVCIQFLQTLSAIGTEYKTHFLYGFSRFYQRETWRPWSVKNGMFFLSLCKI